MPFESDVLFPKPSRRHILTTCCILLVFTVVGLLSSMMWTVRPSSYRLMEDGEREMIGAVQNPLDSVLDPLDSLNYLKGPPTDKFRDNLRPEVQYISSWISAGWTNDVMTYINLIYLGILTNRVAIVPMFIPSHIGGSVPPIDFGDVFDVPRLRKAMKKPLLEWHEVKNRSSEVVDELGCWNTWEAVQQREPFPRGSAITSWLKLDISYTKAPSWIKLIPRYEHDMHSDFSSLAVLGFPEGRAENAVEPRESPQGHVKLSPDEHMLCYDYLYYVCAHQPYEFDFDHSPAWLFVGQFMHWTTELESLANQYVRKAFGIEQNMDTPPWIAIHVRHGDFANWCGTVAVDDCFAPISVIARRVEEVRDEILQLKGVAVNHVIMTSDERNATWWEAVAAQGWYRIDSSDTAELYSAWHPLLIDAVIQSEGMGFVGTDRSTMTVLARRRVQSWRDGAVRTVKWGSPGADDH